MKVSIKRAADARRPPATFSGFRCEGPHPGFDESDPSRNRYCLSWELGGVTGPGRGPSAPRGWPFSTISLAVLEDHDLIGAPDRRQAGARSRRSCGPARRRLQRVPESSTRSSLVEARGSPRRGSESSGRRGMARAIRHPAARCPPEQTERRVRRRWCSYPFSNPSIELVAVRDAG